MAEEEDPYAVSSDSDDEAKRKPPPKIQIEGRENDINQLKNAFLTDHKTKLIDEAREEELKRISESSEAKKVKQEFEAGRVSNVDENLEEKLKRMERALVGAGRETLMAAKEKFEKGEGDVQVERTAVDVQGAKNMGKIKAAFAPVPIEDQKDCFVCGTIVYPVERLVIGKYLYHINCVRCVKCQKKLSANNYNFHEGNLLCKVHMLEVFHPELAQGMDPATTEEDERGGSDDEEYAVSNKPKQLQGVIKSGVTTVADELAQLRSIKEKKGDFETSVKEADRVEKRTKIEEELPEAGRVRANADRFLTGAANEKDDEDKPKKEELKFDTVGEIKNRWQTGGVETAEQREAAERKELEMLKGLSVKDRFKEGMQEGNVEKHWDQSELNTSGIAEARKSFLDGQAYQGAAVERTTVDQVDVQLGNIKAAFEKGAVDEADMTPEERAEMKRKEIEAEFFKYKMARKIAAEKAKDEPEEEQQEKSGLDVEIKMAGKAREKFRQIDASGAQPLAPGQPTAKMGPSKWDKQGDGSTAEVINRREVQADDEAEDPDAYDVKNLMNKFKNIGESSNKAMTSEHRAELEALRSGAKDVKQRFETGNLDDSDVADQRRQQMQEEFERLRQEREEALRRALEEQEAEERERDVFEKEDIGVKAEHASKMTAKWEKITAKEAKKAEKSKMPEKRGNAKFHVLPQPKCSLCQKTVYRAEQFQCFSNLYHLNCFRCNICKQALRVERVQRSKEGLLFCNTHFKEYEKCAEKLRLLATNNEENNNDANLNRSKA
ncbi:hypothetical protein WR25_10043 [Diploscapter pachys]|uniref:LIM zinc-binding domain-containing protein n=1 Tax=Diploscapter pachys TaxID=2018661 RepID=A0A2A2JAM3_9BILA|nr:hypothetical protein WR25_10043 [Diploscapter pachys]